MIIKKEVNKFKVASDKPKSLKLTFLQLNDNLLRLFNISSFLIKSMLLDVQPENSLNIAFSIPTW